MKSIKEIVEFLRDKPHVAYRRVQEISQIWKESGIWGSNLFPSALRSARAANELVEHYGLTVKYQGGLSRNGPWMNWYVWYPKERWKGKPKHHPAAYGMGITLGEAVVRCLLDCEDQGILGDEKVAPEIKEKETGIWIIKERGK